MRFPRLSLGNGWTGGQYSLFRLLLGLYLFQHFVFLLPWGTELFSSAGALPDASLSPLIRLYPNLLGWADSPIVVAAFLLLGAVLALTCALGLADRISALGLLYIWACLLGRNPLISNPAMPYVGFMLLAHVLLPAAPFGSWRARRRPDPAGDWRMPAEIF